ncbi:MAG: hypothetical protein LQ337_004419 [Flavoplaca oasis]|nr:MAG: hypothetical protein LQ337_004419 [Flavoplaca oasis]
MSTSIPTYRDAVNHRSSSSVELSLDVDSDRASIPPVPASHPGVQPQGQTTNPYSGFFRKTNWTDTLRDVAVRAPPSSPSPHGRIPTEDQTMPSSIADEDFLATAREEFSEVVAALMKDEDGAEVNESMDGFQRHNPQTQRANRAVDTAAKWDARDPPDNTTWAPDERTDPTGLEGLWPNDQLAKDLDQLVKSKQDLITELKKLRTQRANSQKHYHQLLSQASKASKKVNKDNQDLSRVLRQIEVIRRQERTKTQSLKRRLQQTSDWLANDEEERKKARI